MKTEMKVDVQDLVSAVELLEAHPSVEAWTIAKITNTEHPLMPVGPGFGVEVWNPSGTVFEKSGTQRTVTEAARRAIERLEARKAARSPRWC